MAIDGAVLRDLRKAADEWGDASGAYETGELVEFLGTVAETLEAIILEIGVDDSGSAETSASKEMTDKAYTNENGIQRLLNSRDGRAFVWPEGNRRGCDWVLTLRSLVRVADLEQILDISRDDIIAAQPTRRSL